jgi:hypothetical protein
VNDPQIGLIILLAITYLRIGTFEQAIQSLRSSNFRYVFR